ncbi:uncharacterized protein CHSO_1070 [Chryseobacterium sp. StRB126]|uniref:hypothetical protein n=1 Tax=Chryseobacterium sp. StRB126 TaxID=878220 RepID=UPI0004E988DC|nr:hypothetical protein [Chryseobacterium sp. StRB126]BAP30107.1 uncharacterized protein CHSO_1070 [Chryseobacterium sp. StRB126]
MKTHYDPFANPNDDYSFSDYGYCGTYIIDENSSADKDSVTCKKCKKKFNQADNEVKIAREQELNDMQGFVDFMNESKKK